jgi:hypothetical protein
MKFTSLFCLSAITLLAATGISEAQTRDQRYQNIGPRKDRSDPRYAPHHSGGNVYAFDQKYRSQAATGQFWRVTSECASACTIGFGHFGKDKMCIARGIRLGFHHGSNNAATAVMWNSYPGDVKALVNARGGLKPEWLWIPSSAFHAIGYKPC